MDWIGIVAGRFQIRAGRSLEDAVAGTLRIALGRDVKPDNDAKNLKMDKGMKEEAVLDRQVYVILLVFNKRVCIPG